MRVLAAMKEGFGEIANLCSKSSVFGNDSPIAVAFVSTIDCLCLLGIAKVSETSQYVDLRARTFVGEVPPGFDYRKGLMENHNLASDAHLGICIYESVEILTLTDNYRYSMLWEPEEIRDIMKLRHVPQFAQLSYKLWGLKPIPNDFFLEMLKKEGFMTLLSISEVDLRIY